ncbi:MAG: helix-turn-helix domain-containing protein, partial [Pirellulaceae bacterium]
MQKDFSPKQVADALRVSESSIKRWCDRGAIQTLKTLGGHRRIPLDSLLAFLESTNREIADYSQLDIGPAPEGVKASPAEAAEERPGLLAGLQESLEAALIRGDERECRRTMI